MKNAGETAKCVNVLCPSKLKLDGLSVHSVNGLKLEVILKVFEE
jgi:hypothetical protein|tara:strand:+ start:768 stop:899 length:132 start_codon:yes stop_codon:yes gene_type:complete